MYNQASDPQEKTDVQRTWMYQVDPGVNAVNKGLAGRKQNLPYDNANSLPLGDGMWSVHPKSTEPGFYRRMRNDVTNIKNVPYSKK